MDDSYSHVRIKRIDTSPPRPFQGRG